MNQYNQLPVAFTLCHAPRQTPGKIPRKVSFYTDDEPTGIGSLDDVEDSEEGSQRERMSFFQQAKGEQLQVVARMAAWSESSGWQAGL